MQTQFITLSIEMGGTAPPGKASALRDDIEAALAQHGQPLRWAIVSVQDTQAQVEAVVICPASVSPAEASALPEELKNAR